MSLSSLAQQLENVIDDSTKNEIKTINETTYEVIGVHKTIHRESSHSFGSEDCEHYEIYLKQNNNLFCLYAATHYSDCFSGWCSATTCYFTLEKQWKLEKPLHFVPASKLTVTLTKGDGQIKLTEFYTDEVVFNASVDGGDYYYPSGGAYLEEKYFKVTPRYCDKRKVYFVTGKSGVGKTSLFTLNSKLNCLELESSKELPDGWECNEVFIFSTKSDKYGHTVEKMKQLLEPYKVDIVNVNMS